jgi:DinB superfamily
VHAEIQRWVDYWDYLDGNFWGICNWLRRDLAPAEIAWQPTPTIASIGWNLMHLGEMLDYYLDRVFKQGPPVRTGPLVTMISGSQDDGRFNSLGDIESYHRVVRPAYRSYLASLSPDDLAQSIERRGGRTITIAWAIGHIHEHESYHLGKCTLLRSWVMARRSGAESLPH